MPPSRLGSLGAVLALVVLSSGPAFARTKKKHPKHAPAHHTIGHQAKQPAQRSRLNPPPTTMARSPRARAPPPAAAIREARKRIKKTTQHAEQDKSDRDSASEAPSASRPKAATRVTRTRTMTQPTRREPASLRRFGAASDSAPSIGG